MFEAIIPRMVKFNSVKWTGPESLEIDEEGNENTHFKMLKGAETYLHKQIGLKTSTSKDVFKLSESIWNQLQKSQLSKSESDPNMSTRFYLDKPSLVYLSDDYNQIIDVFDAINEESKTEFEEQLQKFILDITTRDKTNKFYADGRDGLVKLICYKAGSVLPEQEYTPIVLLEINNNKSTYSAYTGILIYKSFTFIPAVSCLLSEDKLSDFIKYLNIDDALKLSEESSAELYESYQQFEQNPIEVSARELIKILNKVGYKLSLKDDNQLDAIDKMMDEENNAKIQNFFNTFTLKTNETAYDILALPELKKIFRYNSLTLLDVLSILSKEYLSYEGVKITCDILGSIVYSLLDKNNDKKQSESIKEEVIESTNMI